MFCGKCGANVGDKVKFCPKCGAEITKSSNNLNNNKNLNASGTLKIKTLDRKYLIGGLLVFLLLFVVLINKSSNSLFRNPFKPNYRYVFANTVDALISGKRDKILNVLPESQSNFVENFFQEDLCLEEANNVYVKNNKLVFTGDVLNAEYKIEFFVDEKSEIKITENRRACNLTMDGYIKIPSSNITIDIGKELKKIREDANYIPPSVYFFKENKKWYLDLTALNLPDLSDVILTILKSEGKDIIDKLFD